MSELRVLLATNTLGRWAETNGVEYTYNNLLECFRRAGIAVDVLTYGPRDWSERDGSVVIHTCRPRLPLPIDPSLRVDGALRLTGLEKKFRDTRYDIVHSATPDPLGFLAARIARRCGCPLVTVYHTLLDRYAELRAARMFGSPGARLARRIMTCLLSLYYNRSDLILAPSVGTRHSVDRMFEPPVEVLSRGIDTEIFSPARRRRNGDSTVQALYVGRVAPEKNLGLLVEIFSRRPGMVLKVVGDGPYLGRMKRDLPWAEYTGKLTGEPLWQAFADADFFVFPSHTDTFGNVVLQALSSGLPAVVTASMGPREQIEEGVNGFVAGSDEEFARLVDRLAEDRSLRREMGLRARALASQRTWERVFRTLLDQYRLAIDLHGRKAD